MGWKTLNSYLKSIPRISERTVFAIVFVRELSHLEVRHLGQTGIHDFVVALDHNKTVTEYLRDFYFKKIQLLHSSWSCLKWTTDVLFIFIYEVEISCLRLSPGLDRSRGVRDSSLSCSSPHTSRPSRAGELTPGWPHSGQSSPPACSPGCPSS